MKRTVLLALAAALALSCDKQPPAPATSPDAGPPPEPSTAEATSTKPLEAGGTLTSKSGATLTWSQGFAAGHILDLAMCGTRLYALSRGGRLVEWDPATLAPKQVLTDFGAVSSIDANDHMLLAGTADGRLLRTGCDGHGATESPDSPWPIEWVHLDVRSKKRAFVVYRESPEAGNKVVGDHAAVTLVNLETSEARPPFRRAWVPGGSVFGFVDYKGELWFGLTPAKGRSQVWYLERFDESQPPLAGLGEEVLRGFVQISREVWGYGGLADGTSSLIHRVDSNRVKPMWDGKKAWFGEQPGGELPTRPIVAVAKQGKDLVVATTGNVYRTDVELRRWRKLHANDPVDNVMRDATAPISHGKTLFLGTSKGLVAIQGEGWKRATAPGFEPTATAGASPAGEVSWRGQSWVATPRGLTTQASGSAKAKPFRLGPKKRVHGLFVDAADRLWVLAHDGIWVLTGTAKGQQQRFDTAAIGAAPSLVSSIAASGAGDPLTFTMSYGAEFRIQVAEK